VRVEKSATSQAWVTERMREIGILPTASSWRTKTSELGRSGFSQTRTFSRSRQSGLNATQMECSIHICGCLHNSRADQPSDAPLTV
jgi:hypothetical protein